MKFLRNILDKIEPHLENMIKKTCINKDDFLKNTKYLQVIRVKNCLE